MSARFFPRRGLALGVASAGLVLVLLASACSDGAAPDPTFADGTFAVALPQFNVQSVGPCGVSAFNLVVTPDAAGPPVAQVGGLTYGCATVQTNAPLYWQGVTRSGDSLEVVWTDDTLAQPHTLVVRWGTSRHDIAGSATLTVSEVISPVTVGWTGVRQ